MKARQVFIALMTGKGYSESELEWDGEKFTNANMVTRWNNFILGWEMRGVDGIYLESLVAFATLVEAKLKEKNT